MEVTIHEAKTHLSRLIAAVERGEEVIISRRDKPVVRLVIESPTKAKRRLGFMLKAGQVPPNFDGLFDKELDEEIERDFYGAVEARKPYRLGSAPE